MTIGKYKVEISQESTDRNNLVLCFTQRHNPAGTKEIHLDFIMPIDVYTYMYIRQMLACDTKHQVLVQSKDDLYNCKFSLPQPIKLKNVLNKMIELQRNQVLK